MMGIYEKVKAYFDWYEAEFHTDRNNALVIAVSGGFDSLALLHLLARRDMYPAESLFVAHLDHGLRPSSADDANFVARTAHNWGLTCFVNRIDVAEKAQRNAQGIEEAGREARYRFLAAIAKQEGGSAVATAHNADDQAETVLMHLLRGTGLDGLRGMPPIGPMPEALEIKLLRPLLDVRRSEIEAYCQAHDLRPVIDTSNADTTYFRNRLRHELLPILREYNPEIDERLAVTAELVTADYELLDQSVKTVWPDLLTQQGQGWLRIDLDGWRALPLAMRRRTLRYAIRQLHEMQIDVSYRTIELARHVAEDGQVGAQAPLPGNIVLTVEYDSISIMAAGVQGLQLNLPQLKNDETQKMTVPGHIVLDNGWRLEVEVVEEVDLERVSANKDPWLAYIDAGADDELVVRPKAPGERFWPLGMDGRSAKVSRVMIDRKVPAALRERWPIVANRKHLLWLVGQQIDERGRVTAQSSRVLRLRAFVKG